MQLYSRLEGDGPTLVFTHGWTMSHRFFERQRSLSDRFRILFWDLPGHGDSEKRPEGYSLSDCSQALHELLEERGIKEAVALGWSMGAQVTWDYFRKFGAGPFSHFVNIESLPWGDPDYYRAPDVEKSFYRNRPRAARKFVKAMFHQAPEPTILDWMVEDSLRSPTEIALRYYREIANCDYREIFRHAPVPVVSLLSRYGHHFGRTAEFADLRSHQDWFWFDHSGHMPFWEEPELFNALLAERFGS
ncbi:MAG: alpha/beta hydrolase [Deltaproteobacteria bacterium]|nr:alpha/beta hydrolase [Deltaproteobacteria bacterium]